jgi:endonuclease G
MKKILMLFLFFRLLFINASYNLLACDLPAHFDFEVSSNDELLYYGCYDAIHKGPHIIEYILTNERAESTGTRRPSARFTKDRDGGLLQNLLIENGFSLPDHYDYTNSGYDRGHMAPNADFNDTYENALMTFFIANIWPQTPQVNRIEWLKTENRTRALASEYLTVKVIITVDEFSEYYVKEIQIPVNFKRTVYELESGKLIYEAVVYQ